MGRAIMSVFSQRAQVPDANQAASPMGAPSEQSSSAEIKGSAQRSIITLGKTLVFKGELCADEDMALLGRVEGSVTHTGTLTVEVGGTVLGDVRGRLITIKGTVEGDIEASESVVVVPGAVVTGDIVAPRISIIEGATFNGTVEMVTSAATATPKVATSPADVATLTDEAADQLLRWLSARRKV
ncbi:MAG: bactofilin family protein [Bryobacteraceae bacterium]